MLSMFLATDGTHSLLVGLRRLSLDWIGLCEELLSDVIPDFKPNEMVADLRACLL